MTGPIDPRDIRVGDAEREHVGEVLQNAVGRGRLTLSEFDERMSAAMAARTRGELDAVVADLAEPGLVTRPAVAAAKKALVLKAEMSNIARRGYWVVPETMRVECGWSNATLDFTRAEFTAPTTTIDAEIATGTLRLIVPVGAIVDLDDVRAEMGSIKDRTTRHPDDSGPHIVVRGRASMGNVIVQHARRRRLGPLTIHSPFRITWGHRD